MLTKKDLADIKQLMSEQINGVNNQIHGISNQLNSIEERFVGIDKQFDSIEERFAGIDKRFDAMDKRFDGIDKRFAGIDNRLDAMDKRFDDIDVQISSINKRVSNLEDEVAEIKENMVQKEEFIGLRQVVYEWRDYSHSKFIMLENEVIPKISALYEMSDLYVKQMECRKNREKADKRLDCIEPLKTTAKSHSERLAKHDEILEKLVTNAG